MTTSQLRTGDPHPAQTPCPCCASLAARLVATRDGKTGAPLTTVSCEACGLGRTDPLPSPEALRQWYTTSYRQEYKSAFEPALRHVLRAGRIAMDRWAWLKAQDWQEPTAAHRPATLDIGASSGEFVYLMNKLGFEATGLEPHEGYASYARGQLGLDVRKGSVQDLPLQDLNRRWDLISLFHVFEHLSDPIVSLQTLASQLSERGVLFIEVPNATRPCSPHSMFFKAHVLYFSAQTLRQTLHAAGWQVLGQGADDDGNLRVLARPGGQTDWRAPASHDHSLVRAQQARRWGPYLMDELRSGRVLRKLSVRREEKRTAGQFGSGRDLLEALYSGLARGPMPAAASPAAST